MLAEGVVTDGRTVYAMIPPRAIAAYDARSGATRWRSTAAIMPLLLDRGRLLAVLTPAVGSGNPHTLRLGLIDVASGRVVHDIEPVSLPDWATGEVGEGVNGGFRVWAAQSGDTGYVRWWTNSGQRGGAYRRDRHGESAAGVVKLDLVSGRVLGTLDSIPDWQAPDSIRLTTEQVGTASRVVLHRVVGGATIDTVIATGATAYLQSRLSADQRHALIYRQVNGPRIRYETTVFSTADARAVGSISLTDVLSGFVVDGRRLLGVFSSTAPRQSPIPVISVRAIDLASGRTLFSRPVRDLRFYGPAPP